MRLGVVERHYLLCPFCGHRQDLVERRCIGCGAKPVAVVWEAGSPELALVGRPRVRLTVADDEVAFARGRAQSLRTTWHDEFARCPECGNATVGLAPPYAINHAAPCRAAEVLREGP